jgi:hypothetical protein
VPTRKHTTKKKRSGPEPEVISLHPLEFDEALDILLKAKPKKKDAKQIKEEGKSAPE